MSSDASGTLFDRFNSKTKLLLIGPTFRLDLARGLGLEFDALYERVNYDFTLLGSGPGYFSQTFQQTTANHWQFPLLVQYGFGVGKAKPFVEAGPSILHMSATKSNITTTSSTPPSPKISSVAGQTGTWAGFTTGGGFDVRLSRLHLRPEFRYSRWFSSTTGPPGGSFFSGGLGIFFPPEPTHLNQNEATFLLGATF